MQRVGETCAVHADLALADETAFPHVHELDGILDGEDMALQARIDVVDHRGERGRFAGAGLARHQNEPVGGARHLAHRLWQLQLIHRERFGGNDAEHAAHAVQLAHDIDAKASAVGKRVGEVGAVLRLEAIERRLRHDLVQRFFDERRIEAVRPQGPKVAEQANAWWVTGDEVQIRAALVDDLAQECVNGCHASGLLGCRGRRPGADTRAGSGGLELRQKARVGHVLLEEALLGGVGIGIVRVDFLRRDGGE